MLKYFLLLIVIFFTIPVYGQTVLTGEVNYNIQSEKEELFNTPRKKLDSFLVAKNINDKNNIENLKYYLKGNVELKDRTLAFFSDSTYAVMYYSDMYHVWYYSKTENLFIRKKKTRLNTLTNPINIPFQADWSIWGCVYQKMKPSFIHLKVGLSLTG